MTGKDSRNKIMVITVMAILGLGTYASADRGMGYGHHQWMHQGPGRHHRAYGDLCGDYMGNLSEDEIKKLEEEHSAFFNATKELRQEIYQKRLELRSEFAKKNPETEKAVNLQKEISDLKARFDQERLDYWLKIKKIDPDFGRGFMGRGRKGYDMMASREHGGDFCPNFPFRGFRRGYGMGAGMMGPGYEMGPGWQGREYAQPSRQVKSLSTAEDAKAIVEDYIQSTRNPNLKLGKIEDAGDAFRADIVTQDNSLVDQVLVDKTSGWMRPAY